MFDIVGYALIKKGATKIVSPAPISDFTDGRVRVMEFADDGGVLVVNASGNAVAMVEKEDVISSFRCNLEADVVCPPNLNILQRYEYAAKCSLRKGGYNHIVREMVIAASLHKKEFNDGFLWQKQ